MQQRPEEEGQGTFPTRAQKVVGSRDARFEIARDLFIRTATQVGVLTFNPEGSTWLELLCSSAGLGTEDRSLLMSGARNLARRCLEAAEASLTVFGITAVGPATGEQPRGGYCCPHCKSEDVALCFPCWVSANDIDRQSSWDLDVEAQPEKDSERGWCPRCGTNILVERREVR
jgi:hypothetical protein